ncbi:Diaminopimelate epimerase-like protein [Schizophyllum commune H4-8]|nr:Diaminopimelate epimerase-like protein [Schizophyllum commune H4-8]KAI5888235.1 Diaminopimelate epimerase-like protein [Schizophyllum commune H4-8]
MMTRKIPFSTLDVFTNRPFIGNQLGVVRVPADTSLSQVQRAAIAREFNLSETIFVNEPVDAGDGSVVIVPINIHLRGGGEIPFAGHPTVGGGYYNARRFPGREIVLRTLAGDMPVTRILDANGNLTGTRVGVAVDFMDHGPLETPRLAELQPDLTADDYVQRTAKGSDAEVDIYPTASIVKGMTFVLLELASVDALGRMNVFPTRVRPAHGALGDWEGLVGVYAFVRLGEEGNTIKLRTRMMIGPSEDPATGSAASTLAGWLGKQKGPGSWNIRITQGVEMGRRSEIEVNVKIADSGEIESIQLGGSVCEVMEGNIVAPEEVTR